MAGSDQWEGKIRILKKSINEATTMIKTLQTQVASGQKDFNDEFADIRDQITVLKNEQKRSVNEMKSEVINTMKEMHYILRNAHPEHVRKEGDSVGVLSRQ